MNNTQTFKTGTGVLSRDIDINQRPPSDGIAARGRIPRSVEQMLAEYTHIPAQTAVLGVCEDGFPILFDLLDDRPGPIMICGDPGSGKTRLMKSILKTVTALNSPYEVQYSVIATNPEEWLEFEGTSEETHCFAFDPCYEESAGKSIVRLSEIAEQRRMGREMGPAILMVIDDLRFIARADFDVRLNFEWLLKNGPAVQIWPVVSLPTDAAVDMSRVVSHFRTRLIGKMASGANKRLALYDGLAAQELECGNEFAVRVQDQWLNFWLPARI